MKLLGEVLVFVTSNTARVIENNTAVCNSKRCHKYKEGCVTNEDTNKTNNLLEALTQNV